MKRISLVLLPCLLLVMILAGLFLRPTFAHGAAAAPPSSGKSWTVVKGPNNSLYRSSDGLTGVAAISANDIWAVGYIGGGGHALFGHWNGTAWSVVPQTIRGYIVLNGIAAITTNDVWAVGEVFYGGTRHALVVHWDGTAWSIVANPAPTNSILTAVSALSSTDIWAVGDKVTRGDLIMHWNGVAWSIVPAPSGYLTAVTAISATDVWAVGATTNEVNVGRTLIEHWDGKNWKVVASSAITGSYLSGVAAISANDVWAVGFVSTRLQQGQTLTEHWNGTQWTVVQSPNLRQVCELTAVSVMSASNIWAVGYSYDIHSNDMFTLILHWNGTAWSVVSSPDPGSPDNLLSGIARVPGTTQLWAVGGYSRSISSIKTLTEFHR